MQGENLGTGLETWESTLCPRGFLRCEVGAGQMVEDEVGKEVGRVLVWVLSAPPSLPSLQIPVQEFGGAASSPCCHSKHPCLPVFIMCVFCVEIVSLLACLH